MVALVPVKDVRHVPHDALVAVVVLPRARDPRPRVQDVHLARRVVVPEEHAGEDGHKVLLVVHVRDGRDGRVGVHVVGEGLVADAREAEADVGDLRGGEVEREVDGVEEGDGGTCVRGRK